MKKLFFTLSLFLLFIGFADAAVLFDPATYTPVGPYQKDTTINGVLYLRIQVDGTWDDTISIPSFIIPAGATSLSFNYLYAQDTSTINDSISNLYFQFTGSTNDTIDSQDSASQLASLVTIPFPPAGSFNKIKFIAENTYNNWQPITGSYMFISKVVVAVPFSLQTFTGDVPAGDSIKTVNGKQYLKVLLNGWTILPVAPLVTTAGYSLNFNYYYDQDTSTIKASGVDGYIQFMDSTGADNITAISNSPVTTTQATATAVNKTVPADTFTSVKFAAQNTAAGGWPAVSGSYIYISQVTQNPPPPFNLENFTGTVPMGDSIKTINGKQYLKVLLNGWTILPVAPLVTTAGYSLNFNYYYDQDTSTIKASGVDGYIQFMDSTGADNITAISNSPVTTTQATATAVNKTVPADTFTSVKFAAQNTAASGWPAVVGSYIYISQVTVNPPPPFNISTFEGTVPAGCTLVDTTINKESMQLLRVSLNGWQTDPSIQQLVFGNNEIVTFSYLYEKGSSSDATSAVKAYFQFMGIDKANSNIAIIDNPASATFKKVTSTLSPDTISSLQLYGQQLASPYGPETGSIMYLSKFVFSYPPFNMETFEGTVPAGCALVDTTIGTKSTQLLRVSLDGNGWPQFPIEPIITKSKDSAVFSYIYNEGTSKVANSDISAYIELVDSAKFKDVIIKDNPASASLKQLKQILLSDTITQMQFAGQNTANSWNAVTGSQIYISKIVITTDTTTKKQSVNSLSIDGSLNVYPNPTAENLTISLQGLTSYAIIDITGKVVIESVVTGDIQTVSVGSLTSGIYFVKATNGSSTYTAKFIKN